MPEKYTGIVNLGGDMKISGCVIGDGASVTIIDGKVVEKKDSKQPTSKDSKKGQR